MATKNRRSGKHASSSSKPPEPAKEIAEEKGLTTFSIRLTDEQRDLLTRACELKGWTPTSLIRTATLEKAVHTVNTSRVTRFDFKGLAASVAGRLFESRKVGYQLSPDELNWLCSGPSGDAPVIDVPVEAFPIGVVFSLKRAARLGGTEFLNLIVEFAEGLTASQRNDLPEPVDPGKTEA